MVDGQKYAWRQGPMSAVLLPLAASTPATGSSHLPAFSFPF
ncbi:MAG: hypothetical protein ACUVRZ_01435 [Desulfobacca sp.]